MDALCHGQNRSSFFSKCFFSLIDPSLYAYVHRLYICQGRCSSLRKLYCHLIILQNLRKSLFRNVCFRYYPPQNIKHRMLWISKNKEFLYKILYKIQPILSWSTILFFLNLKLFQVCKLLQDTSEKKLLIKETCNLNCNYSNFSWDPNVLNFRLVFLTAFGTYVWSYI